MPQSSAAGRDHPGVIAPPPLIHLGFLALGALLEWLLPTATLPAPVRVPAGAALLILGLALIAAAVLQFRRAQTAVEPWKPSTALLRSGLYRWSRNPIYVAGTIASIGIALLADSLWMLAALIPAVLLLHYGVVLREERYLEARFGAAYRDYKAAVRRWL